MYGSKSSNFRRSTFKLKIQLFVLTKNLTKQLVLVAQSILKLDKLGKRLSKDRSPLTSESESFYEDPPLIMRHNQVKLPFLHLIFSSSSELEESSLEKLKSLKAAHAQDMIF